MNVEVCEKKNVGEQGISYLILLFLSGFRAESLPHEQLVFGKEIAESEVVSCVC